MYHVQPSVIAYIPCYWDSVNVVDLSFIFIVLVLDLVDKPLKWERDMYGSNPD